MRDRNASEQQGAQLAATTFFAPSDARWAVVLDGTGIDSADAGAAVGVIGLAGGCGKSATVSHEAHSVRTGHARVRRLAAMRNLFRKAPPYITVPGRARPAAQDKEAESLWVRCENERCRELLYVREFENNLNVCHKCDHHARLSARERIRQLVDEGTFTEHDAELAPADPLSFAAAGASYRQKLAEAATRSGEREAAIAGSATLDGLHIQILVLDFAFMGASMGSVVGEKIARAADRAAQRQAALVSVSASGGARMQEGIFSLMQMAKSVTALASLGAAQIPHISILVDPTLGGVTASYAGVGDVIIAEQGALVGFAGPRVIEQITKQKLPADAQRAAFLLEHGMVDLVLHRRELRPTLTRLLRLYAGVRQPALARA